MSVCTNITKIADDAGSEVLQVTIDTTRRFLTLNVAPTSRRQNRSRAISAINHHSDM